MEIISNWCKAFTLENNAQVLATKDYDADKEMYLIRIETRFHIEDATLTPSVNLSYEDEEKRNDKFNLINETQALSMFNGLHAEIKKMLE